MDSGTDEVVSICRYAMLRCVRCYSLEDLQAVSMLSNTPRIPNRYERPELVIPVYPNDKARHRLALRWDLAPIRHCHE